MPEDNRIPTLEQMIAEAKGRIRLMIELKNNGHGSGMEEAVLSLIDRYDAAAQCVIASMDDAILKKVKELNPDIKTAYITAVAYGDFEGLKEADMFSIEATFATRGLISRCTESENRFMYGRSTMRSRCAGHWKPALTES